MRKQQFPGEAEDLFSTKIREVSLEGVREKTNKQTTFNFKLPIVTALKFTKMCLGPSL